MEGSSRIIVVGVGLNSQVGRIMSLLGATKHDSKKQKNKNKNNENEMIMKKTLDNTKKQKILNTSSPTKVSPDQLEQNQKQDKRSDVCIEEEKQNSIDQQIHNRPSSLLKQFDRDEHKIKSLNNEKQKSSNKTENDKYEHDSVLEITKQQQDGNIQQQTSNDVELRSKFTSKDHHDVRKKSTGLDENIQNVNIDEGEPTTTKHKCKSFE